MMSAYQSAFLAALCVSAGCAGQADLNGQWVNETRVHFIGPGQLRIVLMGDGTGEVQFDRKKYYWFWTKFTYSVQGHEIAVVPTIPSASRPIPETENDWQEQSIKAFNSKIRFRLDGDDISLEFMDKKYKFKRIRQ